MTKTKKLIRQGKRQGKKEARKEKREKLRQETGYRFPKFRKALGIVWKVAKFIPFRPLGGQILTAGEIVEEIIEERKNGIKEINQKS